MAKIADNFLEIMHNLQNGQYKPIYVLHGDEPYYIDQISNYIEENVLREDERGFNQIVMYGADTNAAAIADQARQFPMMAERQVIIVKEAQTIKKWDQLEHYLDNPSPTSVIVICHKNGKVDGRKKVFTKAAKVGVVYESKKKYDSELPSFISQYMRDKYSEVSIDQKAIMMVAEHIGNDLSRIASELDKVVAALPEEGNKSITPDVVEQNVGISKEYNGFELQDALAAKDFVKAMRIADYFAKDPKVKDSVFSMMGGLFNYFQTLMICHYAPCKKTDMELSQYLGLRGAWFARKFAMGVRNYSAMKTLNIISKIRETDIRMKGVDNRSASPGDLLRELVFYILS